MLLSASSSNLPSLAEIWEERQRRLNLDDDGLHSSIKALFGFHLARTPACSDHQAPFQFLSDLYFGRVQRALGLGPRGGGKTRMVSILEWLSACRRPTHLFHAGGVEEQARRGYAYIQEYIGLPQFAGLITDSLISQTRWANGSHLEIHAATIAQLSGGHPNVKVADEVEMWGLEPLERFYGMGVADVQTVFISTRDRATGIMQTLLDEASKRQLAVYSWCIWDVKQECLTCLHGDCELWDECQGRYQHSTGHRPRKDVIDKFLSVSRDTWEAQYLCTRPGRQGLVFPDFVSEPGEPEHSNVTEAAEFDPALSVEVWCDDNVAQPRAIALVQIDGLGRYRIFEEYYLAGRLQEASVRDVLATLQERGKFPELAVVPAEAAALKLAFHEQQVDTTSPRDYRRKEGAAVAAKAICSMNRQRALLLHPRCINFIRSLRMAYRKEVAPGIYEDEPAKHADDHAQDATMYGLWVHRLN